VAVRDTTSSWQRAFLVLGSIVLIVGALYFAQSVLVPVVLAVLLTFVLNPLVCVLHRHGVHRVLAVILVVALAFAVVGAVGYVVVAQVQNFIADLPNHKDRIAQKLVHIRETGKGAWFDRLNGLIRDVEKEMKTLEDKQTNEPESGADAEATQPLSVRIETSSLPMLRSVAGSAIEVLVRAGLVIVLVAFMLIKREDLRNRLVRLWGPASLTSMTHALDDAGARISRYLLMQLLVNSGFGVCMAVGLWLIGVPYAVLWGFLGGCLRYIPYVGVWVAALFPLVLSIAVKDGWMPPLEVLGLLLLLELVISNVVEPWVFGRSIGVSEVALLIAVAFWTWLWGPLGLVLSTPLTACLAVMGRYVPSLEFIGVLLCDAPVLEPCTAYYQRLLAHDHDEAADLVEEYARTHNSEEVFDRVLVPALSLARRDRETGELSSEDEELILRVTRELLDEVFLSPPIDQAAAGDHAEEEVGRVTIFGCPARDEMDELTLAMLRLLLDPAQGHFKVVSAKILTAEVVLRVRAENAGVVCIGTLPPQNLAHARYLCKRLRSHLPGLKILVGCWGWQGDRADVEERLKAAGADMVATSLLEARTQVLPLVQALNHMQPPHDLAQTA
jgi:predicted PurR-regulated permease PerM